MPQVVIDALQLVEIRVGIMFNNPISDGGSPEPIVTIDFRYVDSTKHASLFETRVPLGKKLTITNSEIQASLSLEFDSQLVFEIWAGATQETYDALWGYPYNSTYNPCLQFRMIYRSHKDFINDSACGKTIIPYNTSHPEFPHGPIVEFPFPYNAVIELPATGQAPYGNVVLRMYMVNDIPLGNTDMATGTLWGFMRDL